MKLWCEIFVGVEVIRLDHDGLGGRGRRDCHVGPEQLYGTLGYISALLSVFNNGFNLFSTCKCPLLSIYFFISTNPCRSMSLPNILMLRQIF
jgi:hypothetical protein